MNPMDMYHRKALISIAKVSSCVFQLLCEMRKEVLGEFYTIKIFRYKQGIYLVLAQKYSKTKLDSLYPYIKNLKENQIIEFY